MYSFELKSAFACCRSRS